MSSSYVNAPALSQEIEMCMKAFVAMCDADATTMSTLMKNDQHLANSLLKHMSQALTIKCFTTLSLLTSAMAVSSLLYIVDGDRSLLSTIDIIARIYNNETLTGTDVLADNLARAEETGRISLLRDMVKLLSKQALMSEFRDTTVAAWCINHCLKVQKSSSNGAVRYVSYYDGMICRLICMKGIAMWINRMAEILPSTPEAVAMVSSMLKGIVDSSRENWENPHEGLSSLAREVLEKVHNLCMSTPDLSKIRVHDEILYALKLVPWTLKSKSGQLSLLLSSVGARVWSF